MATRKPRRGRPAKTRRGSSRTGWFWWTAGALSLGWIAFGAERSLPLPPIPELRQMATSLRGALTPAPSTPVASAVAARPVEPRSLAAAREPVRQPAQQPRGVQQPARLEAPRPTTTPARATAAVQPPAAIGDDSADSRVAVILPTRRPEGASVRPAPLLTREATPLRREPSADAPAWVVIEAGKPVRVTGSRGPWRRVETGIFTGWIAADAIRAAELAPLAIPARATQASADAGRPLPRGTIPGAER